MQLSKEMGLANLGRRSYTAINISGMLWWMFSAHTLSTSTLGPEEGFYSSETHGNGVSFSPL